MSSCAPERIEVRITPLGCVVRTYQQVNAYGRLSEHITLEGPESLTTTEEPTDDQHDDSHAR